MGEWIETEIYEKIPKHWFYSTLGELGVFKNGLNFNKNAFGEDIPIVNVKQLHGGRFASLDKLDKLTKQTVKKVEDYSVKKGDILFARSSVKLEGTGQVSMIGIEPKEPTCFSGFIIRYRIQDKNIINENFLNYLLRSNAYRNFFISIATGTSIFNLTQEILSNVKIYYPGIEEQKAITEVLSSLDDKIDLLHRQNKTFEELAQTLFRQWFIEEANDDWEVCKLEDIAVIQNGFAFSSRHYVEEESEHLEVLKMGHIERGGGLKLNPKKDFVPREEKLEKYILNKNDIVLAMTDMKDNVVILGVPAIIDKSDKYVLNQRVARIYLKSSDKLLNSYLLYIQLKDPEFIALLQSTANSGVQVNLSTASIRESEVIIPPMDLQRTKGQDITDLYLKKENNDLQIKTLENMRDTLLPKLMSGEVRVKL